MKILFAHNDYGVHTGEERFINLASKTMQKNGHEVLFLRKSSVSLRDSLAGQAQAFFSGIYSRRARHEMVDMLKRHSVDVVHVQNLYPLLSPSILAPVKQRGIPIVMRCPNYRLFCPNGLFFSQGEICERCVGGKEWWCVIRNCENSVPKSVGYALRNSAARVSNSILPNVDTFVVLSHYQRKRFIEFGLPADDVTVLNNPLDASALDEPVRLGTTVGFMGRPSSEKGIDLFLDAARRLPDIPFAIAGDSQSFSHVRDMAPPNVEMRGFLKGEELAGFCREMKMLVVPTTWYEAFPNAMVVAMSYGKPIVASDLGALPEIVKDQETGFLAEPRSLSDLVEKIQRLYNDDALCMRMGEAGRQRAKDKFNMEIFSSRLEEIYQTAIDRNRR